MESFVLCQQDQSPEDLGLISDITDLSFRTVILTEACKMGMQNRGYGRQVKSEVEMSLIHSTIHWSAYFCQILDADLQQ